MFARAPGHRPLALTPLSTRRSGNRQRARVVLRRTFDAESPMCSRNPTRIAYNAPRRVSRASRFAAGGT
jgi:hypothetical protein